MKKFLRGGWLLWLAMAVAGCGGNDPQETDALSSNASARSEQSPGVQKSAASEQLPDEFWRLATSHGGTEWQTDERRSGASPVMTKAVSPEVYRFLNPQTTTLIHASPGTVESASAAGGPLGPTVRLSAKVADRPFGKKAVTLSWTSSGVTTCSASGGWTGARNTWGNADAGVLSADTVFTLVCSGPRGSATRSLLVPVAAGNGTFMGLGMPSRLLVGLGAGNSFPDMKSQQITPDIVDRYLVGNGANSWVSWYGGGGAYVDVFSKEAKDIGAVPMFTLYQMGANTEGNLNAINDPTFMTTYWAQAKLMYQKIGATSQPTLVNIEPDFWGFVHSKAPGGDPTKAPARVSMVAECASQPDTAAGIAGCLLTLGRTYAPNAKMGFPPSFWGNSATTVGNFMAKVGADKADFIVGQTSDRDAGCFEVASPVAECAGRGNGPFYWDETNTTSPNFNESLAEWGTVRSILGNLPILFWQTPMGVPSSTPGGTPKNYRDNRVQYMLTHPTRYTATGVFAIVFSPGGATSADITTDGGQFARLFKAYLANPAPFPQ